MSKASAIDLRRIVDFHFREPYKEYDEYKPKDFKAVCEELGLSNALRVAGAAEGSNSVTASRMGVQKVAKYIQEDPEALFTLPVLLAIQTTDYERKFGIELDELGDMGVFTIMPEMGVTVVDGQHRLAGLFLCDDETLRQMEVPIIFMLNISVPTAARLFQKINGKKRKVNKSVVFDLFDNVPDEYVDDTDERETKRWYTVCVNLYAERRSPFYRQIKTLDVGGGAISQAFFINACKNELSCLRDKSDQQRFDLLYDYFELIQKAFPEDWPKLGGDASDARIDSYSKYVLKERKSQLCTVNGITALLRVFNWLTLNNINVAAVARLRGKVDWTKQYGTGPAAQTRLFEKLKSLIVRHVILEDEYVRWSTEDQLPILERLYQRTKDPSVNARLQVAHDLLVPRDALYQLAMDRNDSVRIAVAGNPSTPKDALFDLADDLDENVRAAVAGNPTTPEDALVQLTRDWDENVKLAVAGNPSSPNEALVRLAKEPFSMKVRLAVAGNPSAPEDALVQLARDLQDGVKLAVAGNPSAPGEVLLRLSRDTNDAVRLAVAGNPFTPGRVLSQLSKDHDVNVRLAVARNLSVSRDALYNLAKDRDEGVRLAVVGNPVFGQ